VIGVNVPARQLMAPNFGKMVTGVLTKTRTAASTVLLQITESALLRNAQRAIGLYQDPYFAIPMSADKLDHFKA
jgi:EAL domain-containing protein (putative c-di-GMP-specific phosphodiesterase class I)